MLPKKNRISRIVFEDLLKCGKNVSGDFLQAKFLFLSSKDSPWGSSSLRGVLASNAKESQFSFVIPKAVSKLAVKRNLLRRRGYASVSKILNNLKQPMLCAFFFKKGSANASFDEIEADVNVILNKIQSP